MFINRIIKTNYSSSFSAKSVKTILIFSIICSLVFFISCKESESVKYSSDGKIMTVKTKTGKRTAYINLPKSVLLNQTAGEEYSLVFVLHGADSSPEEIRTVSGFDSFSDRFNFIFVYPQGVSSRWENVSDNEFFGRMIESLKEKYNVSDIYFTGFSAGAIKVFELAKVYQNCISAIAPVSGLVKNTGFADDIPNVNILHIYSLDDKEVPCEGDEIEGFYSIKKEEELFKEKNTDAVFSKIEYQKQGHVWNKKNADYIVDFFYNHPQKNGHIKVSVSADSVLYPANSQIKVFLHYSSKEPIESIEVFSNSTSVYKNVFKGTEKTDDFVEFDFSTPYEGLFYLHGELKLKSGETIFSTIDPFYISIKNSKNELLDELKTTEITGIEASSSESDELEPWNCIDSVLTTRWSSGWFDNQEITLDLGTIKEVYKMVLFWETANAKEYEIYSSIDKDNWKKVYEKTDSIGGIEIASLEPSEARYLKLKFNKRSTKYGFSLWEIFVLGHI